MFLNLYLFRGLSLRAMLSGTPLSHSHGYTVTPGSCPVKPQSYLQPLSSSGAMRVRGVAKGDLSGGNWGGGLLFYFPHPDLARWLVD